MPLTHLWNLLPHLCHTSPSARSSLRRNDFSLRAAAAAYASSSASASRLAGSPLACATA